MFPEELPRRLIKMFSFVGETVLDPFLGISPGKLRLNNNVTIKLLGIKEDPKIHSKAVSFLMEKTKGKRVFLKYDTLRYDNNNNVSVICTWKTKPSSMRT
jgi:DNA modification methylase